MLVKECMIMNYLMHKGKFIIRLLLLLLCSNINLIIINSNYIYRYVEITEKYMRTAVFDSMPKQIERLDEPYMSK